MHVAFGFIVSGPAGYNEVASAHSLHENFLHVHFELQACDRVLRQLECHVGILIIRPSPQNECGLPVFHGCGGICAWLPWWVGLKLR